MARCWQDVVQRNATRADVSRARARRACLSLTLLLLPANTHAHGGPPAALGIVAADIHGKPNVVLLNEGLAIAREAGWAVACTRNLGDPRTSAGQTPLASSVDGIDTWVIGADDLYLARDGVLTAQGRPDLSRATIVALASDADALFGLHLSSTGSAVVRIDDEAKLPLFRSEQFGAALAVDGERVHLARAAPGEVIRFTFDRRGEPRGEFRSPLAGALAQIRLRPTPNGLFAVTYDGQEYALAAIEEASWEVVLQSPGPIHGPQASAGGQLWVAVDGELMRDTGDGFEAVGETRRVTCLESWGSVVHACVGGDLYALGDDGLQARLFQLDQLSAPDPASVPPAAARECDLQWLLYRGDLERAGLAPRDWIDPGADAADGSVTTDAAPPARDGGGVDAAATDDSSAGCSASRVYSRERALSE